MISSRFRNRLNLFHSYIAKRTRLSGGPVTLTIESTAKCNLSCPMCIRESIYFPPRDMELGLFKKIIDEVKGFLEYAAVYGAGEPLLNPDLPAMIAYCRNHGIPVGISTNATVLNKSLSKALIGAGLRSITFAFDGATPVTYQKLRKGGDFEQVRKNILTFLHMKNEMQSNVFCVLQMVRLKDNQYETSDLIHMWRVKGMDAIRIKMDEVPGHQCRLSAAPGLSPKHPCHLLWRGPMYIHYDGTVFPCCYIFPDQPIGNVKRESLRDIWNSTKMLRLRSAHAQGNIREYEPCLRCPATRPRPEFILVSFLFNMYAIRKAIPSFERMAHLRHIPIFETSD